MSRIGNVAVEVRPTVTLESAVACVMMLNLFLDENEDYRLVLDWNEELGGERWKLTDEPLAPVEGGFYSGPLSNGECERIAEEIEKRFKVNTKRMA